MYDRICKMYVMFLHYISDEKIKTIPETTTESNIFSFKFCIVEQCG